jgi:uncharacterized membrane protein
MVNPDAPRPRLTGWLPMVLGLLAVVVGAVWTLQGLNVLTDSVMSDNRTWAVVGPAVAVIGLILIVIGVRSRSRAKR